MVIGIENIKRWLEFNRCPFWQILKRTDERAIFSFWFPKDSQEAETKTVNDGLAAMDDALDMLAPGSYIVIANRDLKDVKNWRQTVYQHKMGESDSTHPYVGVAETPAPNIDELVRKGIAEEMERRARDARMKEMEAELAAYRKKDNAYQDAVSSAIGQVMPFVTNYGEQFVCGLINALNGHRGEMVAPHGVGRVVNNQKKVDMEEKEIGGDARRLEAVIGRLRQIEPEKWLDLLEALTRIHDTDPGTYNMARNFLLK